jgi:hypothetical protein
MFRVALYARYSSDQQREASIEDQFAPLPALCGEAGMDRSRELS